MKYLIALLEVLVLAVAAAAQTPAPAPAPQPNDGTILTAGVSYINLTNGTGNKVNVTKVDLAVPISNHFSLMYNQYLVPSAQANVYVGGVRGAMLLSQIIKQKPNIKLNLSKFQFYGDLGLGSRHDSISDTRTGFAVALTGGVSYAVASNVTFSFGGGYMKAGIGRSNGLTLYNLDTPLIAPGVKLVF